MKVIALEREQFIQVAELLTAGKLCVLTSAELELVNKLRTEKNLMPVTVIDREPKP